MSVIRPEDDAEPAVKATEPEVGFVAITLPFRTMLCADLSVTLVPAEIVLDVSKSFKLLSEKVLPALDAPKVRLLLALLSLILTVPLPAVLAVRFELLTLIALAVPIDPVPLERLIAAPVSRLFAGVIEPLPPAVNVRVPVAVITLLIVIAPAEAPAVLKLRLFTDVNA